MFYDQLIMPITPYFCSERGAGLPGSLIHGRALIHGRQSARGCRAGPMLYPQEAGGFHFQITLQNFDWKYRQNMSDV